MARNEVIDKDLGYRRLFKALNVLDRESATVGIHGGEYPDGTPVALVAAIHQVKTGWMSQASDLDQRAGAEKLDLMIGAILAGRSPASVLKEVGEDFAQKLRVMIKDLGLVKTGRLLGAIGFKVVAE